MSRLFSLLVAATLIVGCSSSGSPKQSKPRFKSVVELEKDPTSCGLAISVINFQSDGFISPSGEMTYGLTGQATTVTWEFVEARGASDVSRFTRRPASDTATSSGESKLIEFSGSRVVVFEDNQQFVVMNPPRQ